MVLDDDEVARTGLVELLEGYGYQAFALDAGERALESAARDEFDIALVDLKMPGMDGIEVLRRLKATRPNVQVIMITAYATVETAVEAMKLGAFDYITKPFKGEALDAVIKGSIEEMEFGRGLLDLGKGSTDRSGLVVFRELLATRKGLVIAREGTEGLGDMIGAEVHWLTTDGSVGARVDPGDLEGLRALVTAFAQANAGSVVLIVGAELLSEHNDPAVVTETLGDLVNDIAASDCTLLVSARRGSMDGSTPRDIEDHFQRDYVQEMSESLANPTRRAVVQYLARVDRSSFTEVLSNVPEKESPKLSFHMKKLVNYGVIAKDEEGRYHLTERGGSLVGVLRNIDGAGARESRRFIVFEE